MEEEEQQKQQRVGFGRKKIPIEKIERSENRKVTFSKRRSGLFKKASEVCNACAAQVAILVFSQAGRLFTFGYPSIGAVLHRFLRRFGGLAAIQHNQRDDGGVVLEELKVELEAEKRRGDLLQRMLNSCPYYWCDQPVHILGKDQLQDSKVAFRILKQKVTKRLDDYDRLLTLRL